MHSFHVLSERAGICVALGAAWDLADVGFLGEKQTVLQQGHESTRNGAPLSGSHATSFGRAWLQLLGGVPPVCSQAIWREGACPAACVYPFRQVSMWLREPHHKLGAEIRDWREGTILPPRPGRGGF